MAYRLSSANLRGASLAVIAAGFLIQPAMAQDAPASTQSPAAGAQAGPTAASTATTSTDTAATPATQLPTPGAEGASTDTIVVTGSRLANTGFAAPTPVTVVGAAEVARQAAPNISEVLNQVPAFRPQNTPATTAIFASNIGASTADLRGLGANRTLVLINGRRVVASTTQGGSLTPANAVDLNLVPTSLIERVENVTGGASAQYGSDAVAGVVNLILNTKLEGIRGSAQYGQTDSNDAKDYTANLAFGTKLGDRGHFVFGGEYEKNKGAGDCYSRAWCAVAWNTVSNPVRTNGIASQLVLPNTTTSTATRNGIITGVPAAFAAGVNTALFASTLTGTEFNSNGTTFKHDYGTYYGVPIFQSGGGDGVQPFYENFPIYSPMTRYSLFGHGNYDLTDNITAFVEGSYARVRGTTLGAQIRDLGSITIQRDNPYLPASVTAAMDAAGARAISVGRIGDDLGPGYAVVHRETYRAVAGLEGKLGGSWKWNVYYQYGRTNYDQSQSNDRINSRFTKAVDAVRNAAGNIVCRVNADAITTNDDPACQPLNIFGQNNFSPAAKAYTYGTATQSTNLTQNVVSADIEGDLFNTWAGPVSVAFGGEYRSDAAHGTADPISVANDFYTSPGSPINGKINVKEGFAEVGVPLARDMSFAHSLDLNGAVRYTDYSVTGGVTSWKVGATYEPIRELRFRATHSRDIRAPNVFELYQPAQSSYQLIPDPTKGNVNYLTLTLNQGYSGLRPEKADTWTAGVVLQPDFWGLNRLRLSVDYYDIKLKGAIASLSASVIVAQCAAGNAAVCQFVSRDSTGTLTQVVNPLLNLNELITRGVDIEGSYNLPLSDVAASLPGNLGLRVLATYVKDLTTVTPAGIATNRAGQNGSPVSSPSGVPHWTVNSYLSYTGNRFSAQAQLRYISPGVRDVTLIGPDQAGYSTTLANSTNNNHIKAYYYVNINAQYDIIKRGNSSVEIFGAINNLFDKDPPVAPSSFGPTNNVLYDVLGRTYRVGLRFAY